LLEEEMSNTLQRAYVRGIDGSDEVKTGVIFYDEQPNDRVDDNLFIEDLGAEADYRWKIPLRAGDSSITFKDYTEAEKRLIERAGVGYNFADSYPELDLSQRPLALLHRYYVSFEGMRVHDDGSMSPDTFRSIVYSSDGLHPEDVEHYYYISDCGPEFGDGRFSAAISNYEVSGATIEEAEEKLRAEFADEDREELWPKFSPLDLSEPTPLPKEDSEDKPSSPFQL
jgi:hypothetical protein